MAAGDCQAQWCAWARGRHPLFWHDGSPAINAPCSFLMDHGWGYSRPLVEVVSGAVPSDHCPPAGADSSVTVVSVGVVGMETGTLPCGQDPPSRMVWLAFGWMKRLEDAPIGQKPPPALSAPCPSLTVWLAFGWMKRLEDAPSVHKPPPALSAPQPSLCPWLVLPTPSLLLLSPPVLDKVGSTAGARGAYLGGRNSGPTHRGMSRVSPGWSIKCQASGLSKFFLTVTADHAPHSLFR